MGKTQTIMLLLLLEQKFPLEVPLNLSRKALILGGGQHEPRSNSYLDICSVLGLILWVGRDREAMGMRCKHIERGLVWPWFCEKRMLAFEKTEEMKAHCGEGCPAYEEYA